MARLSLLLLSTLSAASAFAPQSQVSFQRDVSVQENFGFDFAEDMAENTPAIILGEANYKQWVGENIDNSFLNRQVRMTL
jgi:hypothetical protein